MSERIERLTAAMVDLWADWSDGWEDNPRAMVIQFVLGLIVCAVGVLAF